MAVRIRDAADDETRAVLPSVESVQRYVRGYEAGKHFPSELYTELYCRALGMTHASLFGVSPATQDTAWDQVPTRSDARNLTSWITATNVSDEAVDNIAQAITLLSESHTATAPGELLRDVTRLHEQIQGLLRAGKQRLRQTRDLFRIDADLLAHGSLLLGDLYFDDAAAGYGSAALLCANEADSNPALAYSVQAKTERWRQHFALSADLARQGFDHSPLTSIRILLASQEAHAAAILGDTRRAREALHRAEDSAAGPIAPDSGTSAWSCPPPRQALFALAVAIRLGDPDSALRAVEMADAAWASGTPLVTATWAQVHLAAGIAHIMRGDLDGTLAELTPVLTLAPQYRMATITGYTSQMDQRLRQRRFRGNSLAMQIRQQICDFNTAAHAALVHSEDR
jgi:hypothetical protein